LILVASQYSDRPDNLFFAIIVSHELVHQWFYAAVGNDVSEYPWLDEGLATFLSYEVLSGLFGPSTAQAQFDQSAATYVAAHQSHPSLSVGSPRYAFPDSSTYSAFVYSGAATFLNAVRSRVGAEAFTEGLHSYYLSQRGEMATPADLIGALQRSCSCSFEDLLQAYGISP
jgi:aminopeptidase N